MSDLDAEFARILDGAATHAETVAFLRASIQRMGDPAALVAGAQAMRARMIPVTAPGDAIDVCGTGGDGAHTLNVSTAVAFVVAACGVPVAKHGNRAMSSKSGAADVLEALGVKLVADAPTLERCLDEAGLAFLFAQNHHPSMRHVAAARREIGQRTIFNLLGPLSNPARVRRQLLGVFAPEFVAPVAEALSALGAERACVLHGAGGVDEITGEQGDMWVHVDGGALTRGHSSALGADANTRAMLNGGSAVENAAALRALLDGSSENGAYRHIVELNAAMALEVGGLSREAAFTLPREAIDGGEALARLDALIALTQNAP